MRYAWLWAAAGCLAGATTSADEILFKSGDRLTGTLVNVEGGKMAFTSKVAGKLTLNMADIRTFSTDAPIKMKLADGTVVQQKVAAATEGQVSLQPEGAAQPQTIALATVSTIDTEEPHWTGAVVAGALFARGNTKSDTANVNLDASRRGDNDRITLGGGYFFASQHDNSTHEKSTSTDNWFAKGKYDYFFSEQFYGYGNILYEKDRIANLDRRVSPGLGVGYQWVERKDLSFFTEGGGSYVYEQYSDPGDTRTYMAARFAYQLEKSFNGYVSGFHNLVYLPSLEYVDTFLVNTDVGLRAKMTERLLIEAKTQMAYNSKPSEDRDKKDLRYILGVGWTF